MKNKKLVPTVFLVSALIAAQVLAQEAPTFRQPILITSIGQSSGAMMGKVLATKAGLEYIYEQRAKPEALDSVKTLVVVLGVSSKGLGAAGVDIEVEITWATELIERARELGIAVIAMHIEGGVRRGAMSDRICSLFGPQTEYMIVKEAGNEDDFFTDLAAREGIPISFVKATLDVVPVLQKLFVH